MKTPLLVANDSRDESRDKDSWGTNLLLESEAPTAAVKRPGLTLTYDGTAPGQGVFVWPEYGGSTIVTIEDDELTFPVIVAIGDFVDGYYAMVENPPTLPGPDDDYWSETAPDSRRYQAWSRLEVDITTINSPVFWATQGWTSGVASTNCASTTRLAASPKAAARQALRYLRRSCPGYYYTSNIVFGPNTFDSKGILYYPYIYRFVTTHVEPYDAVVTVFNDTICTDVIHIYGTSVICAEVLLVVRGDSNIASPGSASFPVCSESVDESYTEGLYIVRRV